jgi:hypothetical protein
MSLTKFAAQALATSAKELATATRQFSHIGRLADPVDEAACAAAEAKGEADAQVNDQQAAFFDGLADSLEG